MTAEVLVYLGTDNLIKLRFSSYDSVRRKLTPLNFSAVYRMVLVFPDMNPPVVFDSAITAGCLQWDSGGNVIFNIAQYDLPVGNFAGQLIAFDPDHPDGQVITDGMTKEKEILFSIRDVMGTGDTPIPDVGYVEEAPADGKLYGRKDRLWQEIDSVVSGVVSVNGKTGVVVLVPADVGAATAAQGALADTAVQPAALSAGLDTKVDKVAGKGLSTEDYSTAEKTKLAGIAAGATANNPDATLLNRANHTGTQPASTISDFNASARAQTEAELVAGSNITITPSGTGATRQLTISSTGGGGGGAVDSVNGQTGVVVLDAGDVGADPTGTASSAVSAHVAASDPHPQYLTSTEGNAAYAPLSHVGAGGTAHANVVASGAAGFMTGADKAKLDGIAAGATANANTDSLSEGSTNLYFTAARVLATALSGLSLVTGGTIVSTDTVLAAFGKLQKQLNDHFGAGGPVHAVVTTAVAGFMSAADKTKLDGVATGATANSPDTTLLSRSNHTGAQPASTISDFAEATDDRVAALLVAGANVTLTYNDAANTLTIASSGGGGGGLTNFTESKNTASPNATVPAVALQVNVTETNADMVLSPKGTGSLLVKIPDASTSGNKRGQRSIDLQMSISDATHVASGVLSAIFGGAANLASGTRSTSVGGQGNSVSGQDAVSVGGGGNSSGGTNSATVGGSGNSVGGISGATLGGNLNNVSGDYSAIIGSQSSTANAANAAVIAGANNTADGPYCVASGFYANARGRYGVEVRSSGRFASSGDAQRGRVILRRSTTDATPTQLSADAAAPSAANQVTLPVNGTYDFLIRLVARAGNTDQASFRITGVITTGVNPAATSIVGTPTVTTVAASSGASSWAVAVSANTTLGCLTVSVTGAASTNIKWVADVETVEVVG